MTAPQFSAKLLLPQHWPTWLLIGFMRLLALLPYRLQLVLGKGAGLLLHKLAKSRRRVAEVNIGLCFPELSAPEQQALVRQVFIDNAIGLFETMMAWFRRPDYLLPLADFKGLDKLAAAKASGQGVILLGAHYSMLDLAGTLTGNHIETSVTYKRQGNPVLNYVMEKGRARSYKAMYVSKDLRTIVKALRAGDTIWYAPDQDFGRRGTVFASFFGIPTATLTATSQLAKLGKAVVLPMTYFRRPDNSGYEIEIYDPLPIPSEDLEADAAVANQFLETQIRRYPSQYLWLHKRFKTQPGNQPRGALYKKKP